MYMLRNINIFTFTISFFIGVCLILCLQYWQPINLMILAFSLLAMCLLTKQRRYLRLIAFCLLTVTLGFMYVNWQVINFSNNYIPAKLEGKKLLVIGKVKDVIKKRTSQTLIVEAVKIYDDHYNRLFIRPTIKVTLYKNQADILPGQIWSFATKLKQPRNYANPGSFDIEKFMFAAKIHAVGYVTPGQTKLLSSHFTPVDYIQILRLKISQFIDQQDYHYGAIIKALTIGVNSLPVEQKLVFQNTGLAHVLAISGLHIGLIAMLIYKLTKRLTSKYNLRIYLTIMSAALYSALAGFSIPTQRALIMLCVVFIAKLLQRHVSSFNTLAIALLLILLWEPLCILSIGFWLSFFAVAAILYLSSSGKKLSLLKFNILITIAMAPLTLLFFSKAPLISPISNFIFIPLISMLIVPSCFLAALSLLMINKHLACLIFGMVNNFFVFMWPLLTKLSHAPIYELTISEQQYINLLIAGIGLAYLLYPKKLPLKPLALICILPLYFYHPASIPYGEVKFTQLDVGQGACSVIQTTKHTIIYDTGPKRFGFDAGSQVLVPFLKHEHIKNIDLLIISHADNDHIGGTEALFANIPVKKLLAGETEKLEKYPMELCHRGQSWVMDEVKFEILHPDQLSLNKKRNDKSCVLKITSKSDKTIMITGDIEKKSEQQLLAAYEQDLATDVLIAPHHGSRTSSSKEFLQVVKPRLAIFPTGYKNRYGHPKLDTIQRYRAINTQVFDTSYTGAISFVTTDVLKLSCYRLEHKKFWNRQL
jgi:competence protein ComEC